MVRIAFTPSAISTSPAHEAKAIQQLFKEESIDFLHLRHPGADPNYIRNILLNIPSEFRDFITLHDHYELALEGLSGGIQLNKRNEEKFQELLRQEEYKPLRISKSCHSLEDMSECEKSGIYEYITLSPIYDSISKPGYYAAFDTNTLSGFLSNINLKVIALGGVTPDKIKILEKTGFSGVAMLGYYLPYFR